DAACFLVRVAQAGEHALDEPALRVAGGLATVDEVLDDALEVHDGPLSACSMPHEWALISRWPFSPALPRATLDISSSVSFRTRSSIPRFFSITRSSIRNRPQLGFQRHGSRPDECHL